MKKVIMKQIVKLMSLTLILLASLQSCDKQETEAIGTDISPENNLSPEEFSQQNSTLNCATISNFGPYSYWSNTIVNSYETQFLIQQSNNASSLFGLNNVPLYFAAGSGTNNALSYSPPRNYIIWGEEFLYSALNYGRVAVAYISAHEVAHQVQFRQGLPSVNGTSNRELEADCFGGYFLRKSYTPNWNTARPAYQFAQSIAGPNGSAHGTSAQRRSALRLGWLIANNSTLTNAQLDSTFFYYYYNYVLSGALKTSGIERPENINESLHNYMLTKIEELRDINSGKISESEFYNLSNN